MAQFSLEEVSNHLPIINDFPTQGVQFRDPSPLFENSSLLNKIIQFTADRIRTSCTVNKIVGIESRGFILGALLASHLKVPFVMIRKAGKSPGLCEKVEYKTEYSSSCIEVQTKSIQSTDRILIVDDLLATGGSCIAAIQLIRKLGAKVSGCFCLSELTYLDGYNNLISTCGVSCYSIIRFKKDGSFSSGTLVRDQDISSALDHRKMNLSGPIVLLYHPDMKHLAEQFIGQYPFVFSVPEIKWGEFPDGYANIEFPYSQIKHKDVVFLMSFTNKETIMDQISLALVLPRQGIKSLTILLPYFPPATMEKVTFEGELATADTYAHILSKSMTALTDRGAARIMIFDIHNVVSRFSFSDNVLYSPMSVVPMFLEKMDKIYGLKNIAICFPDEGARKRFLPYFNKDQKLVICEKVRKGAERFIHIKELLPSDFDLSSVTKYIVFDDLAQSGETLGKCAMLLRGKGAKSISCYVTHVVFPEIQVQNFFQGRCMVK